MPVSGFESHAMPTELPPLVTLGNPRLSQPSMPVAVNQIVNDDFQSRLRTLRLGLEHHGANGIAAPQLGWFERYLLMRDPSNGGDLIYWINPQLKILSADLVWYWEGCLSVPGIKVYVGRPSAVSVAGFDENGEVIERFFAGWEAPLFQHEFDHLAGILFPYRGAEPPHLVRATDFVRRGELPEDWRLSPSQQAKDRT